MARLYASLLKTRKTVSSTLLIRFTNGSKWDFIKTLTPPENLPTFERRCRQVEQAVYPERNELNSELLLANVSQCRQYRNWTKSELL